MKKHRYKNEIIALTILFLMMVGLGYCEHQESNKCRQAGGVDVGQRGVVCVKPDSIINYDGGK